MSDFLHCERCDFWRTGQGAAPAKPDGGGHFQALCMRHPPAAQLAGGQNKITGEQHIQTIAYRPPTWDFEGCGDGRARGPIFSAGASSA